MLSSLGKLFRPKQHSAGTAKNRLQLVLAKERIGLSETQLDAMKKDLCDVISKYFEIDGDSLEIEILRKDGQPALSVNTPLGTQLRPKSFNG
ncbi:MAG: cell division topological specificity factor MinE [SAR324 cluster bacterium]|nr:cell division topological specificity factor MinE [SAR324 cluster bacterium]MBF0352746.1 cell division topological specificity factor MinE [SAR324 cluster bacterium]